MDLAALFSQGGPLAGFAGSSNASAVPSAAAGALGGIGAAMNATPMGALASGVGALATGLAGAAGGGTSAATGGDVKATGGTASKTTNFGNLSFGAGAQAISSQSGAAGTQKDVTLLVVGAIGAGALFIFFATRP